MAQDPQVIVVGAGMAGITTAWALRQVGITSVVLEGRPRIGGRIHSSYKWKGIPVDLGASWLSHLPINPLVDIAHAHKIAMKSSDLFHLNLYDAHGGSRTDDEIGELLVHFSAVYLGVKLEAEKRRAKGKPDVPLSKVLPSVLDAAGVDTRMRLGVQFFLNMSVTEPYAADAKDLSLYNWDDDETLLPLGWTVVPDGYLKILEVLRKGLDVRLDHAVTAVAHDKHGVIVSTKHHGDFKAPYAVVAVPHGVLHNKLIRFSPKLPAWKQEAIDRMQTGLSDKFWFHFPRKFWKSNRDVIGRIDPDGKGQWSTWVNFHRYTKEPVLMCFNRTEHAEALEQMTDDAVVKEAMTVLRDEFGKSIPDPIAMQRSHWLQEPFSSGTLPHLPPGATSEDHRTLARHVGRIRFAGDATHAEMPGMVIGAHFSGLREAASLMERLFLDNIWTGRP